MTEDIEEYGVTDELPDWADDDREDEKPAELAEDDDEDEE